MTAAWYVLLWLVTACSVLALCVVVGLCVWAAASWSRRLRRLEKLTDAIERRTR